MKRTPRPTESEEARPTPSEEAEKLNDLVEQTMKKVAAEPDADIALLAKLDSLRAQVRQTVRRRR